MPLLCWRMLQRQRFKQMNQIENIIYTALNTGDNNEKRAHAEAQIFQLAKDNYTDFFLTLANIISDDSKNILSRQSTATVFKRLLTLLDQNGKFFWDRVSINARLNIKDLLLSTLVSNEIVIMRAGANAIATIASIEIPRQEWLDILTTLAENCQFIEYNIRRASVVTLGFICQQLRNTKSVIDPQSCKQILASLLPCLQKENEIIDLALQALRDSIQFLRPILENLDYCGKFIQFLLPLLNNQNTRSKVYEVMFEFSKHCYLLLGNYLKFVIQFTVAHMQMRNDDSALALSLWETIATEYQERTDLQHLRVEKKEPIPNYVMMAHQEILSEIMACMLILSPSDMDLPQMREAAVAALTVVIECGQLSLVQKVTEGVATIIQSSNPGERQASVLMFSCLSNYLDLDEIEKRFRNGFNFFYKLLQDNDLTVIKNTLNGFVTLSEKFPEVWMDNHEIKHIFSHLLNMSQSNNEDVKLLSLTILCNITEVLGKHHESIANDPKDELKRLVGMFLGALEKGGSMEGLEKVILVIINVVIGTTNMPLVNQLVAHLVQQYQVFSRRNVGDKNIILDHLISLIHTCLLAISKQGAPKPTLKDQIFSLIDTHIRNYGIEPQGINMISAASSCYRKDFKGKMDIYWQYIMQALTQVQQKPLFKATLTCISDIARNHDQYVANQIMKVFRMLVDYMQKPIDRELKTDILKCFGDLALGLKRYTENYLDTIIEITENCFEAVYTFSKQEQERAYAEQLKETLIEMYHCIVFAINDQDRCNATMANHFGNICTFIVRSCESQVNPTVEYMVHCLYLVFDCALFYSSNVQFKQDVQNIINSPQINNLINTVRRHQDRPEVKDLLLYIEDKIALRRN